jgi:branched-chain amino acid transport system ATP-binding protein
MSEAVLVVRNLSRQFGGLAAVNNVSLTLAVGQMHAVIGTNGAGKSTLINLLSGDLRPSSGEILLDGEEIGGRSADYIARMGIGRSYQKTNIFPPFTAFENCRLAAQSRQPRPWHLLRHADRWQDVNAVAEKVLAMTGLAARRHTVASALSHGEQRQLEIALSLATQPRVLLLDEPLAGMGAEESQRMVSLINQLKRDHAIMLVEHDMDAVFAAADVLTVMMNGEILASGTPAEIRANAVVQKAYLGEHTDHA